MLYYVNWGDVGLTCEPARLLGLSCLDICGDLSGQRLPLDATEPRLEPMLNEQGPEDATVAVRLSHVPPRIHYGI